jgi:sugar/nucleoside kinase (ribokinase family)
LTDRTDSRPTILCAGGAVQDIVMRVEIFPQPGHKVQASKFVITGGGQAGNAAVAVAKLGANALYAGTLGGEDDETANQIVAIMERAGVDCSGAVRVPGAQSSVSLILIDAAGEKMIATLRDRGLNDVTSDDPARLAARADAVLADNRYANFVLPIAHEARQRGLPCILDFDKPTPFTDPLLGLSTHVIASADALREATGKDGLPEALREIGRHLNCFLAVTDGPAGYYWLEAGKVRHAPSFKVDAVDTLGAGDTFHGAFAVRLVESGDVVDALRFAAAAAAIKCTRFGGLAGAATRHEVDALLRERSPDVPSPETGR